MRRENPSYASPDSAASRWKAILLGAIAIVAVWAGYEYFWGHDAKLAQVTSSKAEFNLMDRPGDGASEFDREKAPEIYYHVTLNDAPMGWLHLQCDWIDPGGTTARQNRYSTRFVYKSDWTTHCRQRFSAKAASGRWQVRMTLGERVLSTSTFTLK